MGLDTLDNVKDFFRYDMKIKELMSGMVPPVGYMGEDAIIDYSNKAYSDLEGIFFYLEKIDSKIHISDKLTNKLTTLMNDIKREFFNCGNSIEKYKKFYKNRISNMEEHFVDMVKLECYGYGFGGPGYSVTLASTINEVLHLYHSYVINNDNILHEIPELAQKDINEYETISYRGVGIQAFANIYNALPYGSDLGTTDIIGLSDKKAIMMVRDRGHALTLEISILKDEVEVKYYIPKLINVDYINQLPGINRVNLASAGATGTFRIKDINELPSYIWNFVNMVPTDSKYDNISDPPSVKRDKLVNELISKGILEPKNITSKDLLGELKNDILLNSDSEELEEVVEENYFMRM